MKNTTADKWDIGWRSIGKPKAAKVGRETVEEPPAAEQPSGGVIVKSIVHPQKPKVPKSVSVTAKAASKKPAATEAVVQIKHDKPRVTPAKMPASRNKPAPAKNNRNIRSGMELLGVEFILNLAERTNFDSRDEAVMHNIGLNELIRRDSFDQLDSRTLAAYATNDGDFYSRQIQCSAMQILAQRTAGN